MTSDVVLQFRLKKSVQMKVFHITISHGNCIQNNFLYLLGITAQVLSKEGEDLVKGGLDRLGLVVQHIV